MTNPVSKINSFSVISATLSADVATAGTFTASFPSGKNEANFFNAMGHQLVVGQDTYYFPVDFDVTLSTTNITITNKSATTWVSGASIRLQLNEFGQRAYRDNASNGALLSSANATDHIIYSIAPDVAVTNGLSASATVTAPANAVLGGTLTSGGVGTFDTPRNVVGAWTNSTTVTFTGTDMYGNAQTETSASGTSHTGTKAFKTITRITPAATITSATFGSGNAIGLPAFLPSRGNVLMVIQDGEPLIRRAMIPYEIEQTQLLAPTNEQIVAPIAGFIDRNTVIVQAAVTTGGDITVNVGSTAVIGLTNTIADGATAGTVVTDQPTTLTGADTTLQVAARGQIQIVPGAPFATAGEVNGMLEINGWGIFQPGIRTAGGSTALTGDVRGTFVPPVAPDGDIVWQIVMSLPDPGNTGIVTA